jgi:hypothetical protein
MARLSRWSVPGIAAPAGEALLDAITDLVHDGAPQALNNALAELTRTVAHDRDQLGSDPGAADRLRQLQLRLMELASRFEAEQLHLGAELRLVQAEIQARARYAPLLPAVATLDRRG